MAVKMQTGNEPFQAACKKADVLPTRRQFKKWQKRKGTAWKNR